MKMHLRMAPTEYLPINFKISHYFSTPLIKECVYTRKSKWRLYWCVRQLKSQTTYIPRPKSSISHISLAICQTAITYSQKNTIYNSIKFKTLQFDKCHWFKKHNTSTIPSYLKHWIKECVVLSFDLQMRDTWILWLTNERVLRIL